MTVEQLLKALSNLNYQSNVEVAQTMDDIDTCSTDRIASVVVERCFDDDNGDAYETVYLTIK